MKHIRPSITTSLLLVLFALFPNQAPAAEPPTTQPAAFVNPFRSNVRVEVTDDFLIVHSDGIPDHTTGPFPNQFNPNTIRKQNYTFKIPRHPKWSDQISRTPMGPIGVAVNGVPFYNPYNAEGQDAARNEVFDACCGHPDQAGRYHYHIYPKCIHTSFKDEPGKHSPLIGYAFDGYPIYGPLGEDGKRPTDLDACNGHSDPVRGYHYHVTDHFPYIIGGYHGTVDRDNFDSRQLARRLTPGAPGATGAESPRQFHIFPPFLFAGMDLTPDQLKQLDQLQNDTRGKLEHILTPAQIKILDDLRPPRPRPMKTDQPPAER